MFWANKTFGSSKRRSPKDLLGKEKDFKTYSFSKKRIPTGLLGEENLQILMSSSTQHGITKEEKTFGISVITLFMTEPKTRKNILFDNIAIFGIEFKEVNSTCRF